MKHFWILLVLLVGTAPSLQSGYKMYDGRLVDTRDAPKYSAEKHYELACEEYGKGNYEEGSYHFNIIVKNFPKKDFYHDCQFFLGVCHFYDTEYDLANEAFSEYIQCQSNPCYFEEAINYKLQIAECFRTGARKRFFGVKALPKWAFSRTLACEIYNEVIASLPCHEFAAQALWGKANLHWEDFDFKESVDSFQILIRRFPKHELAPEAYLSINRVYLDQARFEFQNPDLLALAEINSKKFARAFPKDERIEEAGGDVQAIREFYARGLFETGQFYERKEKPLASSIYYKTALAEFPDTSYAKCCRYRLSVIAPLCGLDDAAFGEPCGPCR
jgi:outer membrane protein assembly factor BamD (BamD/ComL family)